MHTHEEYMQLALAEALSQLKGGEAAQATLPDGEYHGQAQGFRGFQRR